MAYSNPRFSRRPKSTGKQTHRYGGSGSRPESNKDRRKGKRGPLGFWLLGDGRGVLCGCGGVALRVVRRVRGRITICAGLTVGISYQGGSWGHLSGMEHGRLACRRLSAREIVHPEPWRFAELLGLTAEAA